MKIALIDKLLNRNQDPSKVTIRTLLGFLRLHKARRGFIRAFSKHKLNLHYETIMDMCNEAAPIDWITLAFQWSVTEEGRDYWKDLSHKWIEYLSDDKKLKNLV